MWISCTPLACTVAQGNCPENIIGFRESSEDADALDVWDTRRQLDGSAFWRLDSSDIKFRPLFFAQPSMSRLGRIPANSLDIDDDGDDMDTDFVADRGFYVSADGERRQAELLNLAHKKRRLDPIGLDDPLATWTPVPGEDFTEEDGFVEAAPTVEEAVDGVGPSELGKRKEYISTVSFVVYLRFILFYSLIVHRRIPCRCSGL